MQKPDLKHYLVICYGQNAEKKKQQHRIKVTVNRPGYVLFVFTSEVNLAVRI